MKKLLLLAVIALVAACNKQNTTILTSNYNSFVHSTTANLNDGNSRRYNNALKDCEEGRGTCAGKDVIITAPKKKEFTDASLAGGAAVATLFNTTASLDFIPDFNETFFAPYQAMILSGNYIFIPSEHNNPASNRELYFLVPEVTPTSDNKEFVLVFIIDDGE